MKKTLALFVFALMVSLVAAAAPYDNSNGEKVNAVVDPAVAENFTQFNAAASEIMSGPSEDGKSYIWMVKSNIKAGGRYEAFLKGAVMRVNDEFGINTAFKVPAGKALVFQLPVKNVGNTSSITVNAALINSGNWGEANTPIECGDDGIVVTDTENWGIVGFTLVMPGTQGEEYKPRLFFGMPEGTVQGQAIAINLNESGIPKAFVAQEQPYKIKVKSDYYDALAPDESINLTAEVRNQINSKGTLDQSAINWYVTDAKRTKKIDIKGAFTFKETETGVTLTVGDNAPSGLYSAVAESTENPNVRYGVDFRVESSIPEVAVKEEETTDKVSDDKKIILTLGKKEAIVFGKTVENDVEPKVVNQRTMLPIRFVAEALGAQVLWNQSEADKITVKREDAEIIITLGDSEALVNGKKVFLDSPAFAENNRTYLPLRFVTENLGAEVQWVQETQQIIITK